jgi:hypothetical protein
VAATADAARTAAQTLASEAVAGVDSWLSDATAGIADAKKTAGSSSKAAGVAMDRLVATAIERGRAVKESHPDVAGQVDAVLTKFVARANDVRAQLSSQQLGASRALDEVGPCLPTALRLLPPHMSIYHHGQHIILPMY